MTWSSCHLIAIAVYLLRHGTGSLIRLIVLERTHRRIRSGALCRQSLYDGSDMYGGQGINIYFD
jgi:hypothetical protein